MAFFHRLWVWHERSVGDPGSLALTLPVHLLTSGPPSLQTLMRVMTSFRGSDFAWLSY